MSEWKREGKEEEGMCFMCILAKQLAAFN